MITQLKSLAPNPTGFPLTMLLLEPKSAQSPRATALNSIHAELAHRKSLPDRQEPSPPHGGRVCILDPGALLLIRCCETLRGGYGSSPAK